MCMFIHNVCIHVVYMLCLFVNVCKTAGVCCISKQQFSLLKAWIMELGCDNFRVCVLYVCVKITGSNNEDIYSNSGTY